MPAGELNHIINTDIYLIDQILKGRYNGGGKLLDAGCGGGFTAWAGGGGVKTRAGGASGWSGDRAPPPARRWCARTARS